MRQVSSSGSYAAPSLAGNGSCPKHGYATPPQTISSSPVHAATCAVREVSVGRAIARHGATRCRLGCGSQGSVGEAIGSGLSVGVATEGDGVGESEARDEAEFPSVHAAKRSSAATIERAIGGLIGHPAERTASSSSVRRIRSDVNDQKGSGTFGVFASSRPKARDIGLQACYAPPVDAAVARIAAAQHGVFSRVQILVIGIGDSAIGRRIESGRWARIHPGVYKFLGTPRSWHQDLMAACLAAGPGAVAAHRSGARLWSFSFGAGRVLEITALKARPRALKGVIVHRTRALDPVDMAIVDGIPVTSAARTLIDCAASLHPLVMEEALDDALRRGLFSRSYLAWRLRELGRRGRTGAGALHRLLSARAPGEAVPQSVLETRFLRLVTEAGLPEPLRQYTVRDGGRVLGVIDFAYPEHRVAIEVDGWGHHSGRIKWQSDLSRRNELTSRGWRLIHVTAEDLRFRRTHVLATLRRALTNAESLVLGTVSARRRWESTPECQVRPAPKRPGAERAPPPILPGVAVLGGEPAVPCTRNPL